MELLGQSSGTALKGSRSSAFDLRGNCGSCSRLGEFFTFLWFRQPFTFLRFRQFVRLVVVGAHSVSYLFVVGQVLSGGGEVVEASELSMSSPLLYGRTIIIRRRDSTTYPAACSTRGRSSAALGRPSEIVVGAYLPLPLYPCGVAQRS